jgi:hypothetical protein
LSPHPWTNIEPCRTPGAGRAGVPFTRSGTAARDHQYVFPVLPGVAGIAGVLDAVLAISDVPSLYVRKVTLRLRKGVDRETTSDML